LTPLARTAFRREPVDPFLLMFRIIPQRAIEK
jgi:hypothetical protein